MRRPERVRLLVVVTLFGGSVAHAQPAPAAAAASGVELRQADTLSSPPRAPSAESRTIV